MRQATFITGNQHKADYFSRQMGMDIPHQKMELDEIQSLDLHEIVAHKLKQAYEVMRSPVIVEDVSLSYTALGGMPVPFIRWFVDHSGPEACCRLLDGMDDRSATVLCTFGYYDGTDMQFFDSAMPGRISEHPVGENGFGFDTFFIMDGYDKTRAELDQDEIERTYAELMKPFGKVRQFLSGAE
jgi:inosine triphosphate pyrophosphatase